MSHIFEFVMLICFGAAWPFNIAKTLKTRTSKSRSFFFLIIVEVGYISGAVNNILNGANYVLFFYALNFCMVLTDLTLLTIFRFREKRVQ